MMLSEQEKSLLETLVYATEIDPTTPSYPVSRTYHLDLPHFTNVWLKDESTNRTGTHKDRMAWEIVMVYLDILQSKERGLISTPLPEMSIISAGSAAIAIQSKLRTFGLPPLRLLADKSTDSTTLDYLRNLGCKIYLENLAERELTPRDILQLTENKEGFDITSNQGFDPDKRFYDWLSYEVLDHNPQYVFTPVGSGQLFQNVLNIAKRIVTNDNIDPVYSGNPEVIAECHFIGATTNNSASKAVKLYAPFKPFTDLAEDWLRLFSQRGYCGTKSAIHEVTEEYLEYAYSLFQERKIPAEHSAVAGMAMLYQMKEEIPQDGKIVVISTGKTKFSL